MHVYLQKEKYSMAYVIVLNYKSLQNNTKYMFNKINRRKSLESNAKRLDDGLISTQILKKFDQWLQWRFFLHVEKLSLWYSKHGMLTMCRWFFYSTWWFSMSLVAKWYACFWTRVVFPKNRNRTVLATPGHWPTLKTHCVPSFCFNASKKLTKKIWKKYV